MFSGKTEELLRRIRRAHIARQKVQLFKPVIDRRYSDEELDRMRTRRGYLEISIAKKPVIGMMIGR